MLTSPVSYRTGRALPGDRSMNPSLTFDEPLKENPQRSGRELQLLQHNRFHCWHAQTQLVNPPLLTMELESDFKTALITSEWFWPCLLFISKSKAHLGGKTNRFSLWPHWSLWVTSDTQRWYRRSGLYKKKKNIMTNTLQKKRILQIVASSTLAWQKWQRWHDECFSRLPSRRSRVEKARKEEIFHINYPALEGKKKKITTTTTTTTQRFVKVSHVSYWVECKPLWLILFYRKLHRKHSILNTCVQTVSASEYINHPGGRLKAAQISRGNKQNVAPMLMGFSPLTCAALLIIN